MDSKHLPKTYTGYHLKSLEELKERLEIGMEVNFFMRGVWYLLEWEDETHVMIAVCPDGEGSVYDSWEQLFQNHKIDGRPLAEQWKEFEIANM